MYANLLRRIGCAWSLLVCLLAAAAAVGSWSSTVRAQQPSSVVRNITEASERLEMTVNTSQILTLGTRIPRLVVNNPELVTATPISDTQVQIAARKPGVTQINLWDENGQIYTVTLRGEVVTTPYTGEPGGPSGPSGGGGGASLPGGGTSIGAGQATSPFDIQGWRQVY